MDQVDLKIMQCLIEDPRRTNKSIAKVIEVSEPTVAGRIRAMTAAGLFRVVLQEACPLGDNKGYLFIIEISMTGRSEFDRFGVKLAAFPEILSLHVPSGRLEYVAHCYVRQYDEIGRLVDRINAISSKIYLIKVFPALSVRLRNSMLTSLTENRRADGAEDDPMLAILRRDARTSATGLARQLDLSVTVARQRMLKLLGKPGNRVAVVCDSEAFGYGVWADIRMSVSPQHQAAIMDLLAERDDVVSLISLSGSHNVALFIATRSVRDMDAFLSDVICSLPGLIEHSVTRVRKVLRADENRYLDECPGDSAERLGRLISVTAD